MVCKHFFPVCMLSFHCGVLSCFKVWCSPICLVLLLQLPCSFYFLSISLMRSSLFSTATGLVYITTSQQSSCNDPPPLLLVFIPHTFPPPWVNNMTLWSADWNMFFFLPKALHIGVTLCFRSPLVQETMDLKDRKMHLEQMNCFYIYILSEYC